MTISELIIFYGKYQKWCYRDIKYKYSIGDLVKIPHYIEANIGFREQLGIIQKYSGIENYIYVMSFNTIANRYWVCGFDEDKLESPNVLDLVNYKELAAAFVDWTYENNIKLSTTEFKQMLEQYKNGIDVFI